jgi:hypothetical protein
LHGHMLILEDIPHLQKYDLTLYLNLAPKIQ